MRTGACTLHQSLTAEAASVLKHSLTLARRRGHAQVTPLHVAATLLSSPTSSSNLLRRACLKSHPHHLASHSLQCRALELCFNVALNRLPTTPPPSSGSLIHPLPSLSNALIAALKRAQAHQRRGCIEQQQQLQQQQQQPLLALKVELEQLIISILDDPSVSRVMREAGFSSTSVKNNIEEDNNSVSPPSSFFFDSQREFIRPGSFWQSHLLKPPHPPPQPNPPPNLSPKEDLRVVLEVMLRKQGRRSNTVVVGDTASSTDGLMAELKGRVERGEVPDELKSSHFISLQLSYVHLRLMSKGDVDSKVSDLRAKISSSLASDRGGGGVIIHAGDLRWAVDEETKDGGGGGGDSGFKPVDHMVSEVGKLMADLKGSCNGNGETASNNRVWLLATASYQTYMRCQMRQPSLDTQWALQAVVVPSGGLALSLQAPSSLESRVAKLTQYPFQMLESKALSAKDEEDKLSCCAECTSNYEKEASVLKSGAKDMNSSSSYLPYWLQPHKPDSYSKDALLELRRKWSRLCRNLHPLNIYPPLFNQSLGAKNQLYVPSHPWRGSASLSYDKNNIFAGAGSFSLPNSPQRRNIDSPDNLAQAKIRIGNSNEGDPSAPWLSEVSLHSLKRSLTMEVRTTLALGSTLFSESATSKDQRGGFFAKERELSQQLQENIPWQSEAIPSIVDALLDCRSSDKKGTWLLIEGNDRIGKRRLAKAAAETLFGCLDGFILVKASRASSSVETLTEALRKGLKCVFLIEDIDQAHMNFTDTLAGCLKRGFFEDPSGKEVGLDHGVFILSTSNSAKPEEADDNLDNVVKMRLWVEEVLPGVAMARDHKRSCEWRSSPNQQKKQRMKDIELDLNMCAEEEYQEEEEAVPSDLTQESDCSELHLPHGILESIGARFTLDASPARSQLMSDGISSKLRRVYNDTEGDGCLCIDPAVVEELVAASGSFMEGVFDEWLKEVFQKSLATVRKGGKGKVRLSLEGIEGTVMDSGFLGSALPNRIHLE